MMSVRAALIFVNSGMFQCSARLRARRDRDVICLHLPAAITEMDGSGHRRGSGRGRSAGV